MGQSKKMDHFITIKGVVEP